ncbi:RsfA family transcriptional regulator [Metabacillus iocasae]|uniref:Prespore-specific regulator n=1 Tax=Priestia iocasae TaxID=2291674 RepID=A0ABS2QPN5_9BACI|nr:RsfA family transcriptional regulator [Metabacillus iocasae]MBM7701411.1 prespore-specific regulator [Metabacillus iocasae]
MKVRQDAWTHEDDVLLAETVLSYIRDGFTQLAAFDEVGDKLNRTSAACGFRWNAEVRKNYNHAISLAKKERKERKRAAMTTNTKTIKEKNPTSSPTNDRYFSFDEVIGYLNTLKDDIKQIHHLQFKNKELKEEKDALLKTNKQLKEKIACLSKQQTTIHEDYEALLKIMEHARKEVLFNEQSN